MTKEEQLYLKAMNTEYKNECLCKLLKYKKALLNIPAGWDRSPGSYMTLDLAREKLNIEIERKKEKYWSIAKPFLIGLVLVIIAFVLSFFFRPNNTYIIHQNNQPQPQQQVKSKNEVSPSSNQNIENKNQQTKKAK
jgi:hypothetical protein